MLDLTMVNNQCLSLFGIIVRANRLNRRFTLREMAKKSMISHTLLNKVEQGQTTITSDTYQKITHAFAVDFSMDASKDLVFAEQERKIYDAIYYAEPQKANEAFERIHQDEKYYLTSLNMIDYMIVAVAVYSHIQFKGMEAIVPFVQTLSSVIDLANETQKRRFYLFRAMHHFMNQDPELVKKDIQYVLDLNHDEVNESLARYILARAQGYLHEIVQSNNNYHRAIYLFEQNNNLRRSVYCKTFVAINNMKIYQFNDVMDDLSLALRYATREKLDWLDFVIRMHMVIFEMLHGQYEKALLLANDIEFKNIRYYCLVAYSAIQINNRSVYEKALKAADKSHKPYDKYHVFDHAIRFLAILGNRDQYSDSDYEKALKTFYEATIKGHEFFEMEVAFEHYKAFLVERRRYKDAYRLTNEIITLVKKTIQ